MMAVAEATNSNGTVLGAIITFVLYGVLPMSLAVYLMGSPARRRAIRAKEHAELAGSSSGVAPDADGKAPADAVAPVGKEPG
jgi:hypothetical protein